MEKIEQAFFRGLVILSETPSVPNLDIQPTNEHKHERKLWYVREWAVTPGPAAL
jgi:hypothetical protein